MAVSKTWVNVQASASNTAGSTANSTVRDVSTKFGATIYCKITNGATGPTVPCSVYIQMADDTTPTTPKNIFKATAGVANNGVYEFTFILPPSVKYYRTQFTGNTAQTVTVEAYATEFDTVS